MNLGPIKLSNIPSAMLRWQIITRSKNLSFTCIRLCYPDPTAKRRHRSGAHHLKRNHSTASLFHACGKHQRQFASKEGPKAAKERKPWKKQHHQEHDPRKPFLIDQKKSNASRQTYKIKKSSFTHISAISEQGCSPQFGSGFLPLFCPDLPHKEKEEVGEQPSTQTLPLHRQGQHNPAPSAVQPLLP